MKMKQEHYTYLKAKLEHLAEKIDTHRKWLIADGTAKDIEMRLRWDLLYAAKIDTFICDKLYPYLNDSHIDTALRKIMVDFNK